MLSDFAQRKTNPKSAMTHCVWFVMKRFRVHHCFLGRLNPGGRIVGSCTKSQLTTEDELQSLCH